MTDPEAIQAAMERISRRTVPALRRALVIEQEPSSLPSPDDPLYGLLRTQHQLIARLRRRPCGCGGCEECPNEMTEVHNQEKLTSSRRSSSCR